MTRRRQESLAVRLPRALDAVFRQPGGFRAALQNLRSAVTRGRGKRWMIALSYLWILALIPLVLGRDDREVRWHARHGLALLGAEILLLGAVSLITPLSCILALVALFFYVGILGLHAILIVRGLRGDAFLTPGFERWVGQPPAGEVRQQAPQAAPESGDLSGNPWERRRGPFDLRALFATIRAFVFAPSEAFAATHGRSLRDPASFALLTVLPAGLLSAASAALNPTSPLLAGDDDLMLLLFSIVLWPVSFVIAAVVTHLCLMVLRESASSPIGFPGTLQTICYAQLAVSLVSALTSPLNLVLPLGCLTQPLSLLWYLGLISLGLARFHRITFGRALVANLLGILVMFLALLLAGALLEVASQ